MATTDGTLAAGEGQAGQGGNGRGRRHGLRRRIATGLAVLGCAAALTLGGLRPADIAQAHPAASAAGDPGRPCVYGDALGVPGEGCGAAWPTLVGATTGEPPCVYADARGVPGEGCHPDASASLAH